MADKSEPKVPKPKIPFFVVVGKTIRRGVYRIEAVNWNGALQELLISEGEAFAEKVAISEKIRDLKIENAARLRRAAMKAHFTGDEIDVEIKKFEKEFYG